MLVAATQPGPYHVAASGEAGDELLWVHCVYASRYSQQTLALAFECAERAASACCSEILRCQRERYQATVTSNDTERLWRQVNAGVAQHIAKGFAERTSA